ncbi:MAG: TraR/DksA family transcriptional regulator [Acidobacteriota bacterium]
MHVRPVKKEKEPTRIPTAELSNFRDQLNQKRDDLVTLYRNDVRQAQTLANDSNDDSLDRANNEFSRELSFTLSNNERKMVHQVDEALARLEMGTYNECAACSKPIGLARLKAIPWANYCIECQEMIEAGLLDG